MIRAVAEEKEKRKKKNVAGDSLRSTRMRESGKQKGAKERDPMFTAHANRRQMRNATRTE